MSKRRKIEETKDHFYLDLVELYDKVPEFGRKVLGCLSIQDLCRFSCVSWSCNALVKKFATKKDSYAAKLAVTKPIYQEWNYPKPNFVNENESGSLIGIWRRNVEKNCKNEICNQELEAAVLIKGHLFDLHSDQTYFLEITIGHVISANMHYTNYWYDVQVNKYVITDQGFIVVLINQRKLFFYDKENNLHGHIDVKSSVKSSVILGTKFACQLHSGKLIDLIIFGNEAKPFTMINPTNVCEL
jgi:hypothetical protein